MTGAGARARGGDEVSDYVREMRELIGHRPLMVVGAAAVILNHDDEILLVRRTDMPLWSLPVGVVEVGESVTAGLKREVMEETGLTVVSAEPMALFSGPGQRLQYPNGDIVQSTTTVFLVRQWKGEPRPDNVETSDVRFFPTDALPDDVLPLHRQRLAHLEQYDGEFMLLE